MTSIAELLVIVIVVLAFLWDRRQQAADQRARELAWVEERRELLNRIQAPERLPVAQTAEPFVIPEHEPDQYNQVGQILELAQTGAE